MSETFIQQLSGTVGRKEIDALVEQVVEHPTCFPELYALTRHEEVSIAWHATWVCEKLSIRRPDLFLVPDLRPELKHRAMHGLHGGMRRLWLNTLLHLPACEETDIVFLNFCLERMLAPHETAAGQAVCMKLAYRFCRTVPELLNELQAHLEQMEPDYYPPAVQCARRHILHQIGRHR